MTSSPIDKSKPFFPLAGGADDGWSNEEEATATCFCGAVQLSFPVQGPGFVASFVCNCSDCHKLSASAHATNFTVFDTHLKHLRGQSNLKTYSQSRTVFYKEEGKDNTMTNYFCSTCGSLMYRVGAAFPGMSILRVGSVDDFALQDTKLRPTLEQFTKHRVAWKAPTEGAKQFYEDGLHNEGCRELAQGYGVIVDNNFKGSFNLSGVEDAGSLGRSREEFCTVEANHSDFYQQHQPSVIGVPKLNGLFPKLKEIVDVVPVLADSPQILG